MGIHKVCSWVKIVRILHSLFQDNTFLPEFWLCYRLLESPPCVSLLVVHTACIAPTLRLSTHMYFSDDIRFASSLSAWIQCLLILSVTFFFHAYLEGVSSAITKTDGRSYYQLDTSPHTYWTPRPNQ